MLLLLFIEFYRSDYLLQAYNYITYLIIAFADVFWNFVFRFYVYSFHNNSGCLMQWSFVQFSPEYNRNTANSTCRSICETVEYYRPIHASVKRLTFDISRTRRCFFSCAAVVFCSHLYFVEFFLLAFYRFVWLVFFSRQHYNVLINCVSLWDERWKYVHRILITPNNILNLKKTCKISIVHCISDETKCYFAINASKGNEKEIYLLGICFHYIIYRNGGFFDLNSNNNHYRHEDSTDKSAMCRDK